MGVSARAGTYWRSTSGVVWHAAWTLAAITAAAFGGWPWLLATAGAVSVPWLIELARCRAARAPQSPPAVGSGCVDVAAFQETAWKIDTIRREIERLPRGQFSGSRGKELMAEWRVLYGVLQAQYQGEEVEMPIMEPFPTCPSCAVRGAAAAELDPSGRAWWRTCWECGYRWVERSA